MASRRKNRKRRGPVKTDSINKSQDASAGPPRDPQPNQISLKSDADLATMREAGKITCAALDAAFNAIEEGITTRELDAIAEDVIRSHGATPAFLNLYGFPATCCISLNEEVVHGIPSDRQLKSGDLVSIDCGSIVNGYYSDSARTVQVGSATDGPGRRLIDVCKEALNKAIEQCMPGNRVGDISNAVERFVRDAEFELVREYVGHGVGRKLHEAPAIPNVGPPGVGPKLLEGMTIAIEPMIMVGGFKTKVLEDGWTVSTADGSLSAHFEHTIAITSNGPEVLTA